VPRHDLKGGPTLIFMRKPAPLSEREGLFVRTFLGLIWVVAGLGTAFGDKIEQYDYVWVGSQRPVGLVVATVGLIILISAIRAWRQFLRD